jgi:BirA family biotin operon repressor/biotin-[acetyl-CoA-carboxylase] ligase
LGRQWQTGYGTSIAASTVLKNVKEPFYAGIVVGLAGLELIRECIPQAFSYFKWPNDIYIKDCKVSGILSEGVIARGALQGVVSGIGINVNDDLSGLRRDGVRAISLCEVAKRSFFVEKLRLELAKKIEKYYIMCQSHSECMLSHWRQENRLLGETLVLDLPSGERKTGVFREISDTGAMLLEAGNGDIFCFDCGDVKIDASLIDFESLEKKFLTCTKK